MRSADGFTTTDRVSTKTKVVADKLAATIASVKVEDRVRVVATQKGTTVTANRMDDRGAR